MMEQEQVLFSLPLLRLEPIFKKWMKEAIQEMEKPDSFEKDERLSRKEVCQKYKISFPTLHECMKKGLPFEKIGRKTLFRREELDFFFKSKSNKLKRSY